MTQPQIDLSPLELAVLYWIKAHPGYDWHSVQEGFIPESFEELDAVLASLISKGYLTASTETSARYTPVEHEAKPQRAQEQPAKLRERIFNALTDDVTNNPDKYPIVVEAVGPVWDTHPTPEMLQRCADIAAAQVPTVGMDGVKLREYLDDEIARCSTEKFTSEIHGESIGLEAILAALDRGDFNSPTVPVSGVEAVKAAWDAFVDKAENQDDYFRKRLTLHKAIDALTPAPESSDTQVTVDYGESDDHWRVAKITCGDLPKMTVWKSTDAGRQLAQERFGKDDNGE